MVSLWPWKGEDTSPASFERALATLSTKISKNTAQLDSLHQKSRRLKALWTLYASFAYILYALILGLVVGWKSWGAVEYTAVAGGPVIIYIVRLCLRTYYDYRISIVTGRLDELQKDRDVTIDRLKAATKYNSTQQLLEKYGGTSSPKPSPGGSAQKRKPAKATNSPGTPKGQPKRVSMIPPPTANIPRPNQPAVSPSTPIQQYPSPAPSLPPHLLSSSPATSVRSQPLSPEPGPPEFAPNAFPATPQYSNNEESSRGHWYDRLMDVLLGDDETLPKNRLALICAHCKLVNGQAPPGMRSLADLGKWRCGGCGGWNGEESEAKKIVKDIRSEAEVEGGRGENTEDGKTVEQRVGVDEEDDGMPVPMDDHVEAEELDEDEEEEPPPRPRRGQRKRTEEVEEDEEEESPPKPRRNRPKGGRKQKA